MAQPINHLSPKIEQMLAKLAEKESAVLALRAAGCSAVTRAEYELDDYKNKLLRELRLLDEQYRKQHRRAERLVACSAAERIDQLFSDNSLPKLAK